jgi:hypothetical protein
LAALADGETPQASRKVFRELCTLVGFEADTLAAEHYAPDPEEVDGSKSGRPTFRLAPSANRPNIEHTSVSGEP